MSSAKHDSRRNFLKQSSLGLGAGIFTATNPFTPIATPDPNTKLASEITIATIDLKGLIDQATREERVNPTRRGNKQAEPRFQPQGNTRNLHIHNKIRKHRLEKNKNKNKSMRPLVCSLLNISPHPHPPCS